MDKIWYRNPLKLEVIGRCGGDGKTRMTTQNRQKLNAKKVSAAIKAINYFMDVAERLCISGKRMYCI